MLSHFADGDNGGFYFTSDSAESLIVRNKEIYDGATPSGNSVAMLNLFRLSRLTGNTEYEENAYKTQRAFSKAISETPSAYTQMLNALDFAKGPSTEIVIVGDLKDHDTKVLLDTLRNIYLPNAIIIFKNIKEPAGTDKIVDFTKDMIEIEGKATAYVCFNYNCNLPVSNTDEMLNQLQSK